MSSFDDLDIQHDELVDIYMWIEIDVLYHPPPPPRKKKKKVNSLPCSFAIAHGYCETTESNLSDVDG